ncbi:hypothetical protein CBL_13355 [Carabus blaptoides fortunei]
MLRRERHFVCLSFVAHTYWETVVPSQSFHLVSSRVINATIKTNGRTSDLSSVESTGGVVYRAHITGRTAKRKLDLELKVSFFNNRGYAGIDNGELYIVVGGEGALVDTYSCINSGSWSHFIADC